MLHQDKHELLFLAIKDILQNDSNIAEATVVNELHFYLNKVYAVSRLFGNKIIEQYLNTKTVMEDYLKN